MLGARPAKHLQLAHRQGQKESQKIALVIEEQPLASMAMSYHGVITETFHPREVATSATSQITRKIMERRYVMIWLGLPRLGQGFAPKRRTQALREYAIWTRRPYEAKTLTIIIVMRGRQWQDQSLADLINDKIVTENRQVLCG